MTGQIRTVWVTVYIQAQGVLTHICTATGSGTVRVGNRLVTGRLV